MKVLLTDKEYKEYIKLCDIYARSMRDDEVAAGKHRKEALDDVLIQRLGFWRRAG